MMNVSARTKAFCRPIVGPDELFEELERSSAFLCWFLSEIGAVLVGFHGLISQALSVTYMAGERRLYLERNCRLPESPAHSRRRNREGPASSKGLNSQRGFGPAVEPRRKSRPRSTSLHGSSPCKCQRLSTLRWDRLPPSRPSTKSGARAGGRRLSDRRLHRWLAGTSASAPSSHGAADLLGLNRAHICVRNPCVCGSEPAGLSLPSSYSSVIYPPSRVYPDNGPLPRQHLVKHGTKRPDDCRRVHWLATRLLRRHVRRRPHDHAHLRGSSGERGGLTRVAFRSVVERFGEPNLQHLDGAVDLHLDVDGLQIPVNDPRLVRRLQCLGDLLSDRQRLVDWDGTLF